MAGTNTEPTETPCRVVPDSYKIERPEIKNETCPKFIIDLTNLNKTHNPAYYWVGADRKKQPVSATEIPDIEGVQKIGPTDKIKIGDIIVIKNPDGTGYAKLVTRADYDGSGKLSKLGVRGVHSDGNAGSEKDYSNLLNKNATYDKESKSWTRENWDPCQDGAVEVTIVRPGDCAPASASSVGTPAGGSSAVTGRAGIASAAVQPSRPGAIDIDRLITEEKTRYDKLHTEALSFKSELDKKVRGLAAKNPEKDPYWTLQEKNNHSTRYKLALSTWTSKFSNDYDQANKAKVRFDDILSGVDRQVLAADKPETTKADRLNLYKSAFGDLKSNMDKLTNETSTNSRAQDSHPLIANVTNTTPPASIQEKLAQQTKLLDKLTDDSTKLKEAITAKQKSLGQAEPSKMHKPEWIRDHDTQYRLELSRWQMAKEINDSDFKQFNGMVGRVAGHKSAARNPEATDQQKLTSTMSAVKDLQFNIQHLSARYKID